MINKKSNRFLNLSCRILIYVVLFILPTNYLFGQRTILWKAEHPETKTQSYILGTFHQVGNSFVDSIPQIKTVLAKADIAFFETVDDTDHLRARLNQRNPDFTYREALNKSDVKLLESIASDWHVPINRLTPIELYIKLSQEYILNICGTAKPNDQWRHFDKYLIHLANENNIPVQGFETDSLQTIDINNMASDYNWKRAGPDISEMLSNIKKTKTNTTECEHANQYMNFDFNYLFEEQCSSANIIERNKAWMPVILETLKDQSAFIAVGLLHLSGDCGLIQQLRQNGYKVDPVILKK